MGEQRRGDDDDGAEIALLFIIIMREIAGEIRTGGGEGDGPRRRRRRRYDEVKAESDNRRNATAPERPNEDIKLVYENSSLLALHNSHPSILRRSVGRWVCVGPAATTDDNDDVVTRVGCVENIVIDSRISKLFNHDHPR